MNSNLSARGLLFALWLLGGTLLVFILAPLLGLALTPTANSLREVLGMADVRAAIQLTVETALTAAAIAVLFGAPLAYLLSRVRFPGRRLVEAVVDIPLTIPHTVAGIALLIVYGRDGMIGSPVSHWFGLSFWGTALGVVVAMLFVSVPYAVNSARIGFDAVDPRLEKVARTLGAGPFAVFFRVTLPLAWRAIMTGFSLSFARAVSEFGAVVILAYYPETAPVKIYDLFLQFGLTESAATALIVLVVTLLMFLLMRLFLFGRATRAGVGR